MKFFAVIYLSIGFLQNSNGQSDYSKYFTYPTNLVAATPTIIAGGGNTYLSGTVLIDGSDFGLFLMKLNPQGDLIWRKIIPPMSNSTYYQSPGQNGCVFLGGKVLVSVDYFKLPTFVQQGRILAFSEDGNLAWTQDFESERPVTDGPLVKLDNQNVARISYSQSNDNNYFWQVDKVDSNGNIVWTKEIDAGGKLILDVGGATLHGDTLFFTSSIVENLSATKFDVKINMLSPDGDLIGQKTILALPFQSPGNISLNRTGTRVFYDFYSKIGNSLSPYWCLGNWELGGGMTEECTGQSENLRFARSFHLGVDGGIYGVGDMFIDNQPTSPKIGWAFKLTENGDYSWNKRIIDTLSEYTGGLTDILFNINDTSLLSCGVLYKQSLGVTTSQIWLLKFQSNGCFSENCGDTLYVPSPSSSILSPEKSFRFAIWPNPTSNYVQIETSDFATFELRDMTGKLFLIGDLQEGDSNIEIKGLPIGMYIIVVKQNGAILAKKIIIDRS